MFDDWPEWRVIDSTTLHLTVTGHNGTFWPMVGKTAAERKAAERARRAKTGLARFETWAHPDDHASLRRHAERLAKRRNAK